MMGVVSLAVRVWRTLMRMLWRENDLMLWRDSQGLMCGGGLGGGSPHEESGVLEGGRVSETRRVEYEVYETCLGDSAFLSQEGSQPSEGTCSCCETDCDSRAR